MIKPAEQLTDGDSDMLDTGQEGRQDNIHHNGGGRMSLLDQSPHTQTGKPGTPGVEGAEKC